MQGGLPATLWVSVECRLGGYTRQAFIRYDLSSGALIHLACIRELVMGCCLGRIWWWRTNGNGGCLAECTEVCQRKMEEHLQGLVVASAQIELGPAGSEPAVHDNWRWMGREEVLTVVGAARGWGPSSRCPANTHPPCRPVSPLDDGRTPPSTLEPPAPATRTQKS